MRILAIGQVEDDRNVLRQVNKQTIVPDEVVFYTDTNPVKGINARRLRIAQNHNILKEIVMRTEVDLVWQLEQDVELPEDCLERLIGHYQKLKGKDFGYVSGVQVGRHGIYCLGAWHVYDDSFESLDYRLKGLQQVDATGFYCLLAPKDVWLSGESYWTDEPYGPDVNWGLSIDKRKYVDMDLPIGHKHNGAILLPEHISTCNVKFYRSGNDWKYKTSN